MDSSRPVTTSSPNELNFAYATVTIVEMVTQYLSGYDIMALWCTCSKALQLRLARGGARSFSIVHTTTKEWPARFYSVIKYMPCLTSIIIKQSNSPIWQIGPKLFESFPKSLKKIDFSLPVELGVWLLTQPPVKQSKPHRSRNRRTAASQASSNVVMPKFNISELLPVLEELSIMGGKKYFGYYSATTPHSTKTLKEAKLLFAQSLPTTMKYIYLPELGKNTWKLIQSMPAQLERMKIHCSETEIPTNGFSHFPPHMTSLDISLVDCTLEWTQPYFKDLSHAITSFSCWFTPFLSELVFVGLEDHPMTHMKLVLLKSGTAQPTFFPTHGTIFEHLPRNLESLEMETNAIRNDDQSSLASLPRTLTRCVIYVQTSSMNGVWPPLGYDALPPTLTHLELFNQIYLGDEDIASLPRTITYLNLGICPTSFEIHYTDRNYYVTTLRRWLKLTDACATLLPSKLTYLKVTETAFRSEFLSNLPSSLTELHIGFTKFASPLDPGAFGLLPNGLQKLTIESRPLLPTNTLMSLPERLTSLSTDEGSALTEEIIPALPRSLVSLDIAKSKFLRDCNVKHLPRGLQEIRMKDEDHLTYKAGTFLPINLCTLEVQRISIPNPRPLKKEILQQFPQHLQIYDLPWTNERGNRKVDLETLV